MSPQFSEFTALAAVHVSPLQESTNHVPSRGPYFFCIIILGWNLENVIVIDSDRFQSFALGLFLVEEPNGNNGNNLQFPMIGIFTVQVMSADTTYQSSAGRERQSGPVCGMG